MYQRQLAPADPAPSPSSPLHGAVLRYALRPASPGPSGPDRRCSLLLLRLLLRSRHHHHLLLHHHHHRLHVILLHRKGVAQRVALLLQIRLLPLQEVLRSLRRFFCRAACRIVSAIRRVALVLPSTQRPAVRRGGAVCPADHRTALGGRLRRGAGGCAGGMRGRGGSPVCADICRPYAARSGRGCDVDLSTS